MLHPVIDAVFAWVDGSDPAHIAKRLRYIKDAERPDTLNIAAIPTRFQDSGELWYSVRLARKHAPWLRKIHIVTDDQKPAWLTEEISRDLNINLVGHKDIFGGYEEYLPTFNSRAIEAMISRIPGLAEHFIYFNDDFFIIKPVKPDEFFIGSIPFARGRWVWNNRYLVAFERRIRKLFGDPRWLYGFVGERQEGRELGYIRFFRSAHAPYAIKLSDFSECFRDGSFLSSIIKYRFRNQQQIWPIGYYLNKALKTGKAKVHPPDWEHLYPKDVNEELSGFLEEIDNTARINHLCIQSLDEFPGSYKKLCFEFLSNLLQT